VWVALQPVLRSRDADLLQELDRARRRALAIEIEVLLDGLA
jgi:hypothetical protein